MKIKFLMDFVGTETAGQCHVYGDILELDEISAKVVIDAGKAEEYREVKPEIETKIDVAKQKGKSK